MKKSTIFLLVLVYVASFLIVGIFGISVKSYDSTYYVEKVNVEVAATQVVEGVDPKVIRTVQEEDNIRHYRTVVMFNYVEKTEEDSAGTVVRLKASVHPTNATDPGLRFEANEISDVATVTQEDNKIYFNIAFKQKGSFKFDICATDGYGAITTVQLMYF